MAGLSDGQPVAEESSVAMTIRVRRRAVPVCMDRAIFSERGRMWSGRMFSTDLEALHAMAARLEMPRSWFSEAPETSFPYYRMPSVLRARAAEAGVVELNRFDALLLQYQLEGRLTEATKRSIEAEREKARAKGRHA